MVVCSEANDEARIATDMKMAIGPRIGPESAAKMDSWFSGLPAPRPSSPIPAQAMTATVTMIYRVMMIKMVRVAARPGVLLGFLVSSFMVSTASQPQNMKIDSEMPAAKTEMSVISAGLNQSKLTGVASYA